MYKNVAGQSVTLSAYDSAVGTQKTGDAANLLFYVDKDDGGPVLITSNSGVPTEISSTLSKGDYKIALAQAETNADKAHFTGKSSTTGIVVVSKTIYTIPASWTIPRVTLTDTLTTYTGNTVQTGDAYAVVNDAAFGNAKLVRSTTPANTLSVDASHLVAVPATQKVDIDTIKTNPVVNAGTVTFPTTATLASTTNITAGTITTVTTLSNLPAIPANWLTASGIAANALNGKGDWLLSSSYTAPPSAAAVRAEMDANSTQLASLVAGQVVIDAHVLSRLPTSSYTTPPTAAAISTQVAADLATAHGGGSWLTATGFAVPGSAMTLADGAITDAKFTVPATPTGPATGVLGMLLQLWRLAFKKSDKDSNTGLLKTYADNGTSVLTTQTVSDTGTLQTRGPAS